ncbi:uncharacterized protein F5Z01DRAFT_626174 [Emericellopsis atlantica]|uniref:Uncharacterized protein n=1 Tax=Emericellopsis atlantica TaxID=2614577 RepID=A0A9P8CML6_9HYPO|nr:uncharacterized protein F5Z01DRAFT_626174 [Emericellopsis atlantica]KAG9252150.1 hypothetical protein F5Z01DRAFT_626174 [Emericellopsis atlantica]
MIYNQGNEVHVPNVDLLTLLFELDECAAQEDTPIHAEAAHPEYFFTKAASRTLAKQFAHFLRKEYGIGAHGAGKDVVVSVSTGQSALATLFYGVVAAEGVYSAASGAGTPSDLARQIRQGDSKLLVCSKDLVKLAEKAAEDAGLSKRNVLVLESYPEVKLGSLDGSTKCDFQNELDWRRITDQRELEKTTICMLYSSGTTGLPKGVLITHMNMVASTVIPTRLSRPYYASTGTGYEKRTLGHLPTAHVAGVMGYFVHPVWEAGTVFWMPGFNFEDFVKYAEQLRITVFFTVPPIFMAIAKHPAVKDQFRFMKGAMSGAAPLTGDLQDAASKKLGLEEGITQTWGMSETTGSATYIPPGRTVRMGSLGPLLPNVLMRLVDDDGNDVKRGEAGEALIKGPIVSPGYHDNDKANRESYTSDGWLRTGDILREDDGEFWVVDRKKELIKYKGLQVAPAELEGLLASHPAVLDAAVIGIQQDDTEVPRAYVVLAPPAVGKVKEVDLAQFVEGKVAHYKKLRGGIKFVDSVPRSPSGKILRKDVREMRKREEGSKL